MKVKIIALVLLVALLVPLASGYARTTEDAFKEIDERVAAEKAKEMPATITNYAIIAIIAIVIIASGVYLGLKMYKQNHPPADNTERK